MAQKPNIHDLTSWTIDEHPEGGRRLRLWGRESVGEGEPALPLCEMVFDSQESIPALDEFLKNTTHLGSKG